MVPIYIYNYTSTKRCSLFRVSFQRGVSTHYEVFLLSSSLKEKLIFILRATYQHAKNLAYFAVIYKTLNFLMQRLVGASHPLQNFVSAAVGGYFVFGENNKVNMQV